MSWITFAAVWVALIIGFRLGRVGLTRTQVSPTKVFLCRLP